MTKETDKQEIAKMVAEFKQKGGKVQVFEETGKRFKTWRGKSGAANKGAKKVGLQDRNYTC